MRPSAVTHVISVKTSPAPPSARAPRCTRWKVVGHAVLGAVHRHRRHHDAVLAAPSAEAEGQEHRRHRMLLRRAQGALAEPALDPLEIGLVAAAEILVADALATRQQRIGELARREPGIARHVLEPLGRVARGRLQPHHLDPTLGLVGRERCGQTVVARNGARQRDRVLERELGARADREMRGMRRVAHQHQIAAHPRFVRDAREM